jgi:hypothetical protein
MNRLITKRYSALIVAIIFFQSAVFSQIDNVEFLRAGSADGIKIAQAGLGIPIR